jgi:galactitol-specific phosphotransferase system IIB component
LTSHSGIFGSDSASLLRIGVACVCGCVSGLILKHSLEQVIHEVGLRGILVEACDCEDLSRFHVVFCVDGLVSRVSASPGSRQVYGVMNVFDSDELRSHLLDALAALERFTGDA